MSVHGEPCWYELTTSAIDRSTGFYGPLLGWAFQDAGLPFPYRLATAEGEMVAGLMAPEPAMPDAWMIYFAVTDCDAAAAQAKALGGAVHHPPTDVPGTGRFAILADPQGAVFGVLHPAEGPSSTAFDQKRSGHGNWHELHSSDPVAGLAFYTALLGWRTGQAMDMGDMGTYQLVAAGTGDIGALQPLARPDEPPHWLAYFGHAAVTQGMAQITAQGGRVLHGPHEVPGGAVIAIATDPNGAHFAIVGPR